MYSKPQSLSDNLVTLLREETLQQPMDFMLTYAKFSDRLRGLITREFLEKGWPAFEYAILFNWHKDQLQHIHIDGVPPEKRHASLNVIIKGGEGCKFQWYDAPAFGSGATVNQIVSWRVDDDAAKLIHETPLLPTMLVRTDIPHKVVVESDTILLCLRFRGNPEMF